MEKEERGYGEGAGLFVLLDLGFPFFVRLGPLVFVKTHSFINEGFDEKALSFVSYLKWM